MNNLDKQKLAKRLIEQAVDRYCEEHSPGSFSPKEKKRLSKDAYSKYLANLISLEDIREELK